MKYFINSRLGVILRDAYEIKRDDYTAVDVKDNNVYTVETNEEIIGVFTYNELIEFLSNNNKNVIITYYNVGEVYKCGTLIISEKPVLKLHTYAYNCMDLISLYNKYINKDYETTVNNEHKVYYDITYLVEGVEFKARFEDINDLGIMLDELSDENIFRVDMYRGNKLTASRGNKLIASMKYFDDRDDIFTLELFGKYEEASEFIDLFEEYLR